MKNLTPLFALVALILFAPIAHAAKPWNFHTLQTFCSEVDCADGSAPVAGLARDAAGNLYGTTETGGAHNDGVVFRLKRKAHGWNYQVLHSFCFSCGDGVFPAAGLILDVSGNLYGTTLGGGAHDCGIVFKLSPPKWKLKTLHVFCSDSQDGNAPDTALTYFGKASGAPYDGASPLFGTTSRGGAHNFGTAFTLQPNGNKWTETALYAFCSQANCADGAEPSGDLLMDSSGNLFGNAFFGGSNDGGAVYELSATAKHGQMSESVLYSFCTLADCVDGQGPSGALVMDTQGALLGTAVNTNSENGLVFRLTPQGANWQQSIVHTFCTPPDCADGYQPTAGLIADSSGNVYGTTELGGTGEGGIGAGTVFRLRGTNFADIYQFCSVTNCADGRIPKGALIADPSGALFGVTSQGGETSAAGTVFELVR